MKRCAMAMVVTLLWVAAPLLACLPQPAMSADEMACCQKMAGDCEMGGGHHKCCATTVNRAGVTPAVAPSSTSHDFSVQATVADFVTMAAPIQQLGSKLFIREILPASSPPETLFILKN